MHDIQSPRRRRNQPEIDQLVREFRDSGLNQWEFAQKVGVHPLTVNRWIRTTSVHGANPPASGAGRGIDPTSPPRFVAVEVR
jgi:transposase-like protein